MNTTTSIETRPGAADAPRAERRPRLPVWARAVLTPILFVAILIVLQLAVSLIPGAMELQQQHTWGGLAFGISLTLLMLGAVTGLIALVMRHIDRRPFRRTGIVWTRHSLPGLALGLGIAIIVVWVTLLSGLALGQVHRVTVPPGALTPMALTYAIVWGLAMAFPLQGIPEEFWFRGYLLQVLRRRPIAACWWSALLFASIHVLSNGGQQNALDRLLYLAVPFGFGLIAAVLAVRLQSVWPSVGIHAGFHVAGIPAQLLGISDASRYAWMVTGALFAIIAVALMRGVRATEVVLDR